MNDSIEDIVIEEGSARVFRVESNLNDLFSYPLTLATHYKLEKTYLIPRACNSYISGEWDAKHVYEASITLYPWKLFMSDISFTSCIPLISFRLHFDQ